MVGIQILTRLDLDLSSLIWIIQEACQFAVQSFRLAVKLKSQLSQILRV
jgi:hypothetical protein